MFVIWDLGNVLTGEQLEKIVCRCAFVSVGGVYTVDYKGTFR